MDIYEKIKRGEYLAYSGAYYNAVRQNKLNDIFCKDALEYVGLTGHPKAKRAMELVWDHCKASGHANMVSHLECIAQLLLED